MDIVERQVPITEDNPEKSKKGLYFIKDNFLEFWFKFIYPYKNYLELGDSRYVLDKLKANFADNHVSFVYEKVCAEKVWQLNEKNIIDFKVLKLGRWWDKNNEIDIVGLNYDEKKILFGECKYLKNKVDTDVFFNLVKKSKEVNWFNKERKEYFILFSKSGFTPQLLNLAKARKDLLLLQ